MGTGVEKGITGNEADAERSEPRTLPKTVLTIAEIRNEVEVGMDNSNGNVRCTTFLASLIIKEGVKKVHLSWDTSSS